MQLAVAEFPTTLQSAWDSIEPEIDPQIVPFETRQLLDANGLSIGVLPTFLPAELLRLIDGASTDATNPAFQNGQPESGYLVTHQKIQNRDGESHWLQTAQDIEHLEWLLSDGELESSGSCFQASPGISVQTWQGGNNEVRIELTPEIRYGEKRTRIAVGEDDFAFSDRRRTQRFERLQTTVSLKPGYTLVLWTPDEWGIGGQLLNAPALRKRFLLLRVIQTQRDDLFAPRQNGFHLSK